MQILQSRWWIFDDVVKARQIDKGLPFCFNKQARENKNSSADRPAILSNQYGSFQTFETICPSLVNCVSLNLLRSKTQLFKKKIDILMFSWIAARLHQDTGRLAAARLGKGNWQTSKAFACVSSWIPKKKWKNSGPQWGFFNLHQPDWSVEGVVTRRSWALNKHQMGAWSFVINYNLGSKNK